MFLYYIMYILFCGANKKKRVAKSLISPSLSFFKLFPWGTKYLWHPNRKEVRSQTTTCQRQPLSSGPKSGCLIQVWLCFHFLKKSVEHVHLKAKKTRKQKKWRSESFHLCKFLLDALCTLLFDLLFSWSRFTFFVYTSLCIIHHKKDLWNMLKK